MTATAVAVSEAPDERAKMVSSSASLFDMKGVEEVDDFKALSRVGQRNDNLEDRLMILNALERSIVTSIRVKAVLANIAIAVHPGHLHECHVR